MRLINVKTLEISEFFGDKIPPYGILSHTWGDEEVSFQEMMGLGKGVRELLLNQMESQDWSSPKRRIESQDWSSPKRRIVPTGGEPSAGLRSSTGSANGLLKILNTCRLAKRDSLQWFWVDTCCIDKTSSAELSEAINSMYQWYQSSRKCYAYLEDVPADQDADMSHKQVHLQFQHLALASSRWFTRGWTLQELIAPPRMDFYGQSWQHLGTRDELCATIHYITRIPMKVFQARDRYEWMEYGRVQSTGRIHYLNADLGAYSVAQKMSWASRRECTRAEDLAYCLLGIFDISMPLLYGEGPKAFLRLQEEIFKTTDDHSLLAWTAPEGSSRCWREGSVFADSPSDFHAGGSIVSLQEETGAPSQVTKKGIQIQQPRAEELNRICGLPSSLLRLRLNCGIREKHSRADERQIVLLVAGDSARPRHPNQAPCYRRVITQQHMAVTVPDGESARDSVDDETAFLRTYRHSFGSMMYEMPLTSEPVNIVDVCIHKTASVQISGLVGGWFQTTYCCTPLNSFKLSGNPAPHQEAIASCISYPGGRPFDIEFNLKKAPGQPRIQATYAHRFQHGARGFVQASLRPYALGSANDPKQSAEVRHYVNILDFRGHLLTLSLMVGGVNWYMAISVSSGEQGKVPHVEVLCSVEAPSTYDALPDSKWIRQGSCRSSDFWDYFWSTIVFLEGGWLGGWLGALRIPPEGEAIEEHLIRQD